jgi:hypothetical protein
MQADAAHHAPSPRPPETLIFRMLSLGRVFHCELPIDDLEERGVGQTGTQADFNERPFTLVQLSNPLAHDVDQDLLIGNVFEGFLHKLAVHNFLKKVMVFGIFDATWTVVGYSVHSAIGSRSNSTGLAAPRSQGRPLGTEGVLQIIRAGGPFSQAQGEMTLPLTA